MSDTPNDNAVEVTDDLDLFSEQLFGKKEPEVQEEAVARLDEEDESPTDEDPVATEADDDDSDDDAPDEDHDDDPEPEPKPKKNRKSAHERITELVTEKYELQRQLEALKQEQAKKPSVVAEVKQAVDDAPNPEAVDDKGEVLYPLGEFDPKYIRDLTRHTIRVEQAAADRFRAEQESRRQYEAAREATRTQWTGKLETVETELPDLREKINSLEPVFQSMEPQFGQYIVDTVMTLENGPRVLHYLANNPKEAREIVNSGPAAATLALGRLDVRLAKRPPEEKPKVSKAPAPAPKTVKGTGGKFAASGDTDDLDAFSRAFFARKR